VTNPSLWIPDAGTPRVTRLDDLHTAFHHDGIIRISEMIGEGWAAEDALRAWGAWWTSWTRGVRESIELEAAYER